MSISSISSYHNYFINNTPSGILEEKGVKKLDLDTSTDKSFSNNYDTLKYDSLNIYDYSIAKMNKIGIENLTDGSLSSEQNKEIEIQRLLMSEMMKIAHEDANNSKYGAAYNYDRLVSAYCNVENTTENNGFLDNAFISLGKLIGEEQMEDNLNTIINAAIRDSYNKGNDNCMKEVQSKIDYDVYNTFLEQGREQGRFFTETFLEKYKSDGIETAYHLATKALFNTTEYDNDFKNLLKS